MPIENDLLRGITHRHKDALENLYDKYCNHLYRIGRSRGLDVLEIEALMTELFRIIWNSPVILTQEKSITIAITRLYIDLCKEKVRRSSMTKSILETL